MFTWNLQYVSKKRLEDTLPQLIDRSEADRDVLVRIHTAVHTPEEAVDLAAFIKRLIPWAKILGTSTSAVISGGKLLHDQCVISVTQMAEGSVRVARFPLGDAGSPAPSGEALCGEVRETLVRDDTKLLLAFFTDYQEIERFVVCSRTQMPGVQMVGGLTDWSDILGDAGFVFDETGWSGREAAIAALDGETLEVLADFTTGVQVVGDDHEITKVSGEMIREIDGKPAAEFIHEGIGEEICTKTEIGFYFPLVYTFDGINVPFVIGYYGKDGVGANHFVTPGRKIRRGFFYDRKIVSENRAMYHRVESFEKGETVFSYACRDRYRFYPNSVKWELSAYENSNICGCLTRGEISAAGGKNAFPNCAFALAVAGENPETQQYNPYVFTHTETLAEDNQRLIGFLMDAVQASGRDTGSAMNASLNSFVESCKEKLLYTEKDNIANEAALYMDIRLAGYDRVCVIEVPDVASMRTVFSGQMIEKTHSHFVAECASFAAQKDYRVYLLEPWRVAVAVPSFAASLRDFSEDMRLLQKKLYEATEEYIAVVSFFCVINECTAETVKQVYNAARMEMMQKNMQFYVCDGKEEELDEESIRERYRMVNVINYAISHDGVIPYYQGIYDNKQQSIHHYEALMRLLDENGRIYSPPEFLDVARSYGLLYDTLSMTMVRKVFGAFRDIEERSVSINIGMRDIRNEELTGYIYSFLSTARHPENFIFEILENEDVDEYEALLGFVNNIHRLGGKISIDDFGSGYSNLLHVVSIPSDFLKIDGSIVRECCRNKDSESLVALISSWNKMNTRDSRIVAEYVENKDIQEKLIRYGIDYSQGHLFSKPSPEIPEMRQEKN